MLSEALLAALFILMLIMSIDHRKWRKAMSAGFVESAIQSTALFSQATDHLAFIADCMEESAGSTPIPAIEGMPQMDIKSILTQVLLNKIAMPTSDGSEKEIRQVHEEESDTQTKETED
jgi:hypothetical protein